MASDEPPAFDPAEAFDDAMSDAPTDERVYRTALQLYEPARTADVARRAECAPDTARRHLQRLVELGVIERVTDDPATYRRNDAYFEWRKRQELADRSLDELRNQLEALTARERTFREGYDADAPGDVDAFAHADHGDLDEVWLDLSEWRTVRDRIERLEAVRRRRSAESGSPGSGAV